MANPGDYIRVKTDKETLTGVLIPSPEPARKETLIIKLDNGYNVGISRNRIRDIEIVKKFRPEKTERKARIKVNPHLPKIAVLHTGGTIASRVDYRTGAVYTSFSPEDLLKMFPELFETANFSSSLISNMWSDDLRFKHFEVIAKAVESEVGKGCKGIIVGMGTDNLAVASAALAFIFEKIPVPVILVGAQRSSDRGSSDAGMNLICASRFIAKGGYCGVGICMHESISDKSCVILPPCKTYKLHSSRRDAFQAVNDRPIARIDYKTGEITFLKNFEKNADKGISIKPKMEEKVGLLKIHVNMFPEQFEFFKGYRGLVIEGTGLGHTPGQVPNDICKIHKNIYPAIKNVINSGCIAVMTTQTIFGRVNMHVYDKGTDLTGLGVIPGEDMLANTALVKLSWLLANYPVNEVKELIRKNLRGEISERIEPDEYIDALY